MFQHVAVRCICTLLEAAPHFNFRENLLGAVVENIGSSDDVIRFCYNIFFFLFFLELPVLIYLFWGGGVSRWRPLKK